MREIKFRGKRVDNGEWVYGDLFKASGTTFIVPEHTPLLKLGIKEWIDGFIQVIPETVGQYTGLKGKRGVELYDGDVVLNTYFNQANKCQIMFWEGSFMVQYKKQIDPISEHFCDENDSCVHLEVIGDIYSNPELLNTQQRSE